MCTHDNIRDDQRRPFIKNAADTITTASRLNKHTVAAKMQETDLHYPSETCPFCTIAAAHSFPPTTSTSTSTSTSPASLWRSTSKQDHDLLMQSVPTEEESDPEKTSPSSFVVLRSRDVVAFLDILPMTGGKFCSISLFAFCTPIMRVWWGRCEALERVGL